MEEHDVGSDGESAAGETLKLTARGRPGAHNPPRRRSSARDETKKEIQDDDEATLRELLIRYPAFVLGITPLQVTRLAYTSLAITNTDIRLPIYIPKCSSDYYTLVIILLPK